MGEGESKRVSTVHIPRWRRITIILQGKYSYRNIHLRNDTAQLIAITPSFSFSFPPRSSHTRAPHSSSEELHIFLLEFLLPERLCIKSFLEVVREHCKGTAKKDSIVLQKESSYAILSKDDLKVFVGQIRLKFLLHEARIALRLV